MIRRSILVFSLVIVLCGAGIAGADQHAFNVHDLVAMQRIGDPQASPDGSHAAFVVTTMDLDANKGRRDLWLAATDGSKTRRLTTDPGNEWSPRWLDNGSLLFLSNRTGSSQVWRVDVATGAEVQITDLPLGIESLKIGPKGAALYVGLSVFPACEDPIPCTVKKLEARDKSKTTGMIFDQVFVRHWDTWKDGRRNHVFRIPLDGNTAGTAVDLMSGVDADSPTIPWGGDGDYTISPDDRWLVYTAKVVDGS